VKRRRTIRKSDASARDRVCIKEYRNAHQP
jgi:hypothetical protein